MLPSGRNGVSMIGERQITCRSMTTKRLDSPSAWRLSVTRANSRCEVELPMSMPTVRQLDRVLFPDGARDRVAIGLGQAVVVFVLELEVVHILSDLRSPARSSAAC